MKVCIRCCCCPKPRKVRIVPRLGVVHEQSGPVLPTPQYKTSRTGGMIMAGFALTDSQQVTLSVTFLDKKNNPAQVDGAPAWLVDNPNVLALTPATDGLSCLISAVGPLGSALVTLTADVDLGAGVTNVVGTFAVDITAGTATTVAISAGTPTEQP